VRVPDGEEVANHTVRESCVVRREAFDEALTEVRTGQPLSHESNVIPGADAFAVAEGNMGGALCRERRPARRGRRTWHVRTLLVREPGDLQHRTLAAGADQRPVSGRRLKP
jgi:hypothetical protein